MVNSEPRRNVGVSVNKFCSSILSTCPPHFSLGFPHFSRISCPSILWLSHLFASWNVRCNCYTFGRIAVTWCFPMFTLFFIRTSKSYFESSRSMALLPVPSHQYCPILKRRKGCVFLGKNADVFRNVQDDSLQVWPLWSLASIERDACAFGYLLNPFSFPGFLS